MVLFQAVYRKCVFIEIIERIKLLEASSAEVQYIFDDQILWKFSREGYVLSVFIKDRVQTDPKEISFVIKSKSEFISVELIKN